MEGGGRLETIRTAVEWLFGSDPELRRIIGVTLRMSLTSTIIACLIGIPLGALLGLSEFRGKRFLLRLTHTCMSLPPVVAGLLVFFLLSRSGPLGSLKMLYSVGAMVVAQLLLITPLALGLSASAVTARAPALRETLGGLGLSRRRQLGWALYESRRQLLSVVLTGFGRAISEVGAAQLVGGNIQHKTRVMTTAILLETNKGNFGMAVALGAILFIIAFAVMALAGAMGEDRYAAS